MLVGAHFTERQGITAVFLNAGLGVAAGVTPVVAAHLTGIAVLARMFFINSGFPFRDINLAIQTGDTDECHRAPFQMHPAFCQLGLYVQNVI